MSEQNKAVVRRLFEDHWNRKNGALVSELFAPTVSLHTPDGVLTGLEGAAVLLQAYATAFPDFQLVIDDLVAEEDKVVVRWTFTGTHRGSLADIPATSAESDALSKDLRARGFSFVGSTIIYAHLQATGLVDDHLV